MTMPKYSQPRNPALKGDFAYNTLAINPPILIEDQVVHVFPLRANLSVLQQFIDGYVNIIPPELGRFRVFAPYVQLMVLDYGSMASKRANIGWLTEREVMFTIAVEWYRVVDGRWVFHDWACVTPFIFVDSELAFMLGRLVQGWVKGLCKWLPEGVTPWMEDPGSPTPITSIGAKVFKKLYAGKEQKMRPFLDIVGSPPASLVFVPPDVRGTYAPWEVMANTVSALQGFSQDALGLLNGLGIMPVHAGSTPDNYARMALKMGTMMNPFLPGGAPTRTLNLKQYRDADSPKDYCYQALTNGPFSITSMKEMGLLDDASLIAGDVTGGYSLYLYEWPSLPIIDTLGLDVAREWRGDDVHVAQLKPVLPYWYTVNMLYGPTENIAWRSADKIWHAEDGQTYPPVGGIADPVEGYYNTSLGAFSQEITGPYRFTSSDRVLPLLAHQKALQTFLDSYVNDALNDPLRPRFGVGWRFVVWGPCPGQADRTNADADLARKVTYGMGAGLAYVYMAVTSYETTSSLTDNIGDWASKQVSFMIPVLLQERVSAEGETPERWETRSAGLMPAFTYVNNAMAAVTLAEVDGIPTMKGEFILPPSSWATNDPGCQSLLQVMTEVVPALNLGQGAVSRRILEINRGVMTEGWGYDRARAAAELWGWTFADELTRKWRTRDRATPVGGDEPDVAKADDKKPDERKAFDKALTCAMEVLTAKVPFNIFTLKEFRDAADPERACYQSVVKIPCEIQHVSDLSELEEPLYLQIHEYPSQPIVSMLGLLSTPAGEQDGGLVYDVLPLRPFRLGMTYTQALGQNLWWRSGTLRWNEADAGKALREGAIKSGRRASPGLVEFADALPDDLDAAFHEWRTWETAVREAGERKVDDTLTLNAAAREYAERVEQCEKLQWAKATAFKAGVGAPVGGPLSGIFGSLMDVAANTVAVAEMEMMQSSEALKLTELFDPQMVIEAMLSREWGNQDPESKFRRKQGKLTRTLAESLVNLTTDEERMDRELAFLQKKLAEVKRKRQKDVGDILRLLELFERASLNMAQAANADLDGASWDHPLIAKAYESFFEILGVKGETDAEKMGLWIAQDHINKLTRQAVEAAEREKRDIDWRKIYGDVAALLRLTILPIQRNQALGRLARALAQKPDFCVPRYAVGSEKERERLFPLALSWDWRWFMGEAAGLER